MHHSRLEFKSELTVVPFTARVLLETSNTCVYCKIIKIIILVHKLCNGSGNHGVRLKG
jgi:hypothetical protein